MYLILLPPPAVSLSLSLTHIHTHTHTYITVYAYVCVYVYMICVYRPIYTCCELYCGFQFMTYKIMNLHEFYVRVTVHRNKFLCNKTN